jgi:DNA polymerase
MDQQKVLSKIYNWLVFQKEIGNRFIKASPGIRSFMENETHVFSAHTFLSFEELRKEVLACRKCRLHETRHAVVFGEGPEDARLFIVGDAPGEEEDIQGRPFVGHSGELLTKMLQAIDIDRNSVYITGVLKCRPPENRTPSLDEISTCIHFLKEQIKFVDSHCILALGEKAAHALLGSKLPLHALRGKVHPLDNRHVVVTYHPAYILRLAGERLKTTRKEAWMDLQIIQKLYKMNSLKLPTGVANQKDTNARRTNHEE